MDRAQSCREKLTATPNAINDQYHKKINWFDFLRQMNELVQIIIDVKNVNGIGINLVELLTCI